MKYGNRDQAFNLCEKIKKEKDLLKDLSEPNIQVRIELFGSRYTIATIETWESSEHLFREPAAQFISQLIEATKNNIITLEKELEEL